MDDIQGEGDRAKNHTQAEMGLGWSISGIPRQFISDWQEDNPDLHTSARAQIITISGIGPSGSVELRRRKPWDQQYEWYQTPASDLTFTIYDPQEQDYAGGGEGSFLDLYYHYRTYAETVKDANGTTYIFDHNQSGLYTRRDVDELGCQEPCHENWSQQVLGSVYVKRMTDVWGNQINFYYVTETQTVTGSSQDYVSAVRPDEITYGTASSQNVKVKFVYSQPGERKDTGEANTDNEHQDPFTNHLLTRIEVWVRANGMWEAYTRYDLNYWTCLGATCNPSTWHDRANPDWWWDDYYKLTAGVINSGEQYSYHPLLKEIRQYMCHGPNIITDCVDTNAPNTFYYERMTYFVPTNSPSNDFYLVQAHNGYGGWKRFFYDWTPMPVQWKYEDSGSWECNYKDQYGNISCNTSHTPIANRFRYVVIEVKTYDGKGNRADTVYTHPIPTPTASPSPTPYPPYGFVDYTEGYNNDMFGHTDPPKEAGFTYLGFTQTTVKSYDYIDENNQNHGTLLNEVTTDYFTFISGNGPCWREDPRAGEASHTAIKDRDGISQSETTGAVHFSCIPGPSGTCDDSPSTQWDVCQRRYVDRSNQNYNLNISFIREPRSLLWHAIDKRFADNPNNTVMKTKYVYDWSFDFTGHQSGHGAVLRVQEYGKWNWTTDTDIPGDERITINRYAHNTSLNILNKLIMTCVSSNTTDEYCGPGHSGLTQYYYDGYNTWCRNPSANPPCTDTDLGRIGAQGAVTSVKTFFTPECGNRPNDPDCRRAETYQTYYSNGNLATVTDARNNTTTYTYETVLNALVKTEDNPLHPPTTVTFDFELTPNPPSYWGVPLVVDGPNTNDSVMYAYYLNYDAANGAIPGRLRRIIKPGDENVYTVEYSYFNGTHNAPLAVRTQTRIAGDQYRSSYDFYDGLGQKIQSQVLLENNAGVNTTLSKFDGLGRPVIEYLPGWISSSLFGTYYDYSFQNPSYTTTTYDALSRVTEAHEVNTATGRDVRTVLNGYFDGGFIVGSQDALSKTTYIKSDGLGRQIEVAECLRLRTGLGPPTSANDCPDVPGGPDYQTTSYTYDALSNLTRVVDAANNETLIFYDLAGRKTEMHDPDMGTWTYIYDANGNLTIQVDARNKVLCFAYDALNRLYRKSIGSINQAGQPTCVGDTVIAQYSYDATVGGNQGIGHRTHMESKDSSTNLWNSVDWVYDGRGRVIQERYVIPGSPGGWGEGGGLYTLQFEYNSMDQLTYVAYPGVSPNRERVKQSYNDRGLPYRLWDEDNPSLVYGSAGYEMFGMMTGLDFGNGLHTQYSYDRPRYYRLTGIVTGSFQNIGYTYDDVDNIREIRDTTLGQVETTTFTYDAFHRLETATASGGHYPYSHTHHYTGSGNIDYVVKQGIQVNYEYASTQPHRQPHAVTRMGNDTYSYDPNGNMTQRTEGGGRVTYNQIFDEENRLVQVARISPEGGDTAFITRFVYDGDGNRVKQIAPDGAVTVYIGPWYEQSWGGNTGADSLEMSQSTYLPSEPVVFTLPGCHLIDNTHPYKIYRLTGQSEELIYSPPGYPIEPPLQQCFENWDWDQHINGSDLMAGPGSYRVKVTTLDAEAPFSADFFLDNPGGGGDTSCSSGCGGLSAMSAEGGGLDVTYVNLTGQVLNTADLSYSVERRVNGQWGLVSGPHPVPTGTLTLAPWERLTWNWVGSDNLGEPVPPGEYRVVLEGTGSTVKSSSEDGGAPEASPALGISYYYLGSQRIAMRKGFEVEGAVQTLYYLHSDHLGSTTETTSGSAPVSRIAHERYYPYGGVRYGSAPTSYNYTGQRLDSYINLIEMGARWYDPALGRFISPDPIVPQPGNPQSLNRFSYVLNNPVKYTDPSGYDPLDSQWQTEFLQWLQDTYGVTRGIGQYDVAIRLFSLAFPDEFAKLGLGYFYNTNGSVNETAVREVFENRNAPGRDWANMERILGRLAQHYKPDERWQFARDIATLFGGISDRLNIRVDEWALYVTPTGVQYFRVALWRNGLPDSLTGGREHDDGDANVHHWAWTVAVGYNQGVAGGRWWNDFHERTNPRYAPEDAAMGERGIQMGMALQVTPITPRTVRSTFLRVFPEIYRSGR